VKEPEFTIRDFSQWSDFEACVDLQQHTWGPGFNEVVPINVLRVVQKAGGIAAGAFTTTGELLGFVFGITGIEAGVPVHWSDMLAVYSHVRDQGVGDALKRYQRTALLARGVQRIYWTFDPLESRNAHINFVRLGVIARAYERDLYGASDSPLHAGIGTDRLIVTWEIASQRVLRRLQGLAHPMPHWEALPVVNPVRYERGVLVCAAPVLTLEADHLRIAIPADIQELKTHAAAVAADWRTRTRAAFEHYLGADYVVVDYVRERNSGSYVVARRPLLS
jgi:chorismate synthase